MPRIYKITFVNVSVAAAQDLVTMPGASGKIIKVLRVWVACSNTTLAAGQNLSLRVRYLPATVTLGSGGTGTITPSKNDQGDAACSVSTARTNDTSQASTNGTAVVEWADSCHLYQGCSLRFDNPITVPSGAAVVFELLSTVSGTVNLSGGMEISEEG